MGLKALGVAEFLSESPLVTSIIQENGTLDPDGVPYVLSEETQVKFRNLTQLIGAAFIVVGDEKGIRLIHPYDDRLGKPMRGGDNQKALHWVSLMSRRLKVRWVFLFVVNRRLKTQQGRGHRCGFSWLSIGFFARSN